MPVLAEVSVNAPKLLDVSWLNFHFVIVIYHVYAVRFWVQSYIHSTLQSAGLPILNVMRLLKVVELNLLHCQ